MPDAVLDLVEAAIDLVETLIDLLEAPGLGVDIDAEAAKKYLAEEDAGFFDR